MQAKILVEYIAVRYAQQIDNDQLVEVNCSDFDEYKKLPDAIEFEGKVLGKTGWSSDTGYACYKQNVMLGKRIDVYG